MSPIFPSPSLSPPPTPPPLRIGMEFVQRLRERASLLERVLTSRAALVKLLQRAARPPLDSPEACTRFATEFLEAQARILLPLLALGDATSHVPPPPSAPLQSVQSQTQPGVVAPTTSYSADVDAGAIYRSEGDTRMGPIAGERRRMGTALGRAEESGRAEEPSHGVSPSITQP